MDMINPLLNWFKKLFKQKVYIDLNLQEKLTDTQIRIEHLKKINKELNNKLEKLEPDKLETYWNNKIPPLDNYSYKGRENKHIDPRMYFTNDNILPKIINTNNDKKALESLNWVIKNVKYKPDKNKKGKPIEKWNFAYETFYSHTGDCEDGSILLANIMLKNGIPYWRIRLNVGPVKQGLHAYITYLKEEDNEWYVLDWCYYPKESLEGLKWKNAGKYYKILFSCNKKHNFIKTGLDRI